MKIIWRLLRVCAFALLVNPFAEASENVKTEKSEIVRSHFPSGFMFGAATSAVQIEGSAKGVRGPSVWDHFAHNFSAKIADHSNADIAINSYERYKEDVKLLKDLGLNAYRFSISWTRILPSGTLKGGINKEAVDHYSDLIDELIRNGITPFVTLFHFDSPQSLQDKYGGFLSRSIVHDFRYFSEICFKKYGDRVKHWVTINEPLIIAQYGYDLGVAAPGRCSLQVGGCPAGNSATEPYIVSHNLLLAHATVARMYKEKFQATQKGEIGISLVGQYSEPYSDSPEDQAAAARALEFSLGWYMDPLVFGTYPQSMRNLAKNRLPNFTAEEAKLVKGSFDFIGINYYTSRYAKNIPIDPQAVPISYSRDSFADLKAEKDGLLIGEQAEGSFFLYIYPEGLQKLLEYIKDRYQNLKIYITENGVNEAMVDSRGLKEALNDPHRIAYVLKHLYMTSKALENGVDVKGYFYWSLFDSFEFGSGYNLRYGFYYIDYKDNLKRIPKESAKWVSDFLKSSDTMRDS